LKKTYYSF